MTGEGVTRPAPGGDVACPTSGGGTAGGDVACLASDGGMSGVRMSHPDAGHPVADDMDVGRAVAGGADVGCTNVGRTDAGDVGAHGAVSGDRIGGVVRLEGAPVWLGGVPR